MSTDPEKFAKDMIDAYNNGSTCVDRFHAKDLVWVEYGTQRDSIERGWEDLRIAAEETLEHFPNRHSTVENIVASGDQVVLEIAWSANETLKARIVMVLTINNGKIHREVDYVIPI